MLGKKALAVSKDGKVLVYQLNKLVVAAEVGVASPRRVYFSGVDAGAALAVAPTLFNDLPSGVLGATVSERGVQFLRA